MAFAAVQTTAQGNNAAATNHTVTMPSGIVSGDLLVAVFGHDTFDAVSSVDWPAGWTELFEEEWRDIGGGGSGSYQLRWAIAFRRCDGTEGASITVTTGKSDNSSYIVHRIDGHHTSTDPEYQKSRAISTNPDPPSLTPSWGAEDTLWITALAWNDGTQTCSAAPTNYVNLTTQADSNTSGQGVATATRELNATSEDPGTFTVSGSIITLVATVAVRPAAIGVPSLRTVQAPYRWG